MAFVFDNYLDVYYSNGEECLMGNEEAASILIIGSDLSLVKKYASWLRGHNVRIAISKEIALEIISKKTDVILLDQDLLEFPVGDLFDKIDREGLNHEISVILSNQKANSSSFVDRCYCIDELTEESLSRTVESIISHRSYNSKIEEAFDLASGVGALEAYKDGSNFDFEQEASQMKDQLYEFLNDLDSDLQDFDNADLEALFQQFSPATTSELPARIVERVAALEETEPAELPPLFDAINPDALITIFASPAKGGIRTGQVEFPYSGYTVTVKFDGQPTISIEE